MRQNMIWDKSEIRMECNKSSKIITVESSRLINGLHYALKRVLHAFISASVIESHLQHRVSTRSVTFPSTAHTACCLLSHGWFTGCGSFTSSSVSSFRILAFNFLLSRRVVRIPECVIIGTLSWEKEETRERKPLIREGRWKIPSREGISPPGRRNRVKMRKEVAPGWRSWAAPIGRHEKKRNRHIVSLHFSRTISGTM